jgi:hypothetical protein
LDAGQLNLHGRTGTIGLTQAESTHLHDLAAQIP